MSNSKISALTSATTPLAGTEVLPIVQSGATVKVATDDLTVKNIRSNATTGILQITGPGAGTTRVATVPNANWTAARTDAAQSFTGDQTLSTGNLVIGTSGKGVDFSATPGTGTSELFADYEEGTYTPTISGSTSSGSATYTSQTGYYTKIGNVVYVTAVMVWSGHTGTGNMRLSGLPFTVLNVTGLEPPLSLYLSDIALTALNVGQATFRRNATYAEMLQYPTGGGAATDVPIDAAGTIRYAGCFLTA